MPWEAAWAPLAPLGPSHAATTTPAAAAAAASGGGGTPTSTAAAATAPAPSAPPITAATAASGIAGLQGHDPVASNFHDLVLLFADWFAQVGNKFMPQGGEAVGVAAMPSTVQGRVGLWFKGCMWRWRGSRYLGSKGVGWSKRHV
jgi:hypothetical protein